MRCAGIESTADGDAPWWIGSARTRMSTRLSPCPAAHRVRPRGQLARSARGVRLASMRVPSRAARQRTGNSRYGSVCVDRGVGGRESGIWDFGDLGTGVPWAVWPLPRHCARDSQPCRRPRGGGRGDAPLAWSGRAPLRDTSGATAGTVASSWRLTNNDHRPGSYGWRSRNIKQHAWLRRVITDPAVHLKPVVRER